MTLIADELFPNRAPSNAYAPSKGAAHKNNYLGAMAWHIFHKHRDVVCFCSVGVFELAMKEACELLDRGEIVIKVTSSSGAATIGAVEIRLTHAERKKMPDEGGHTMTDYRCYFMDGKNHIGEVENLSECTDQEAQIISVRLLGLRMQYFAVEVWDRARIVSRDIRAPA
jgi:hypothetical protein